MSKVHQESDFLDVQMTGPQLRALLRDSREFLIEYFLGDQMYEGDTVQDFHILTVDRFIDLEQKKDVIALPRGHAKTTYLRLAFLYIIFFTPIRFLMYVSSEHGAASRSLKVVWDMINDIPAETAFGGVFEKIKITPSDGYYEFVIDWFDEHDRPRRKTVMLYARGQGQTIRGSNINSARPQYVGVDDVEDETAVKTQEGYFKIKTWFDNTLLRSMDRKLGKLAQIGNLIGKQTLLNDNLRDPDYRSLRMGVLRADGEPLWPFLWSTEEIAADLKAAVRRGQSGNWMGEMMNIPSNLENGVIAPDRISYSARRHHADGEKYTHFITIDPAISSNTWADECAIVLHTVDKHGIGQQTEYKHRTGMDPKDMADVIEHFFTNWGVCAVGVEAVQLQAVLLDYFKVEFSVRGYFNLILIPIKAGLTTKTARIKTYGSLLETGETTLPEGEVSVTSQLLAYDVRTKNNTDDLIDACSMYGPMVEEHMHLIESATAVAKAQQHVTVIQEDARH